MIENQNELLEGLTVFDLRSLIGAAQKRLVQVEKEMIEDFRTRLADMADELELSPEAIVGMESNSSEAVSEPSVSKKGNGARRPSKKGYRNPDNPKEIWSGRGRKPRWFTDAIGAGTSEESMRI